MKRTFYIISRICFVLVLPVIAGFFAFGPKLHLSTQPKSAGNDIIKTTENKQLFGFLTQLFSEPELLQENKNAYAQDNDYNNKVVSDEASLTDILDSINPLSGLGNLFKNDPAENIIVPEISGVPTQEPAISLYNYFLTSSAMGFEPGDVQMAVALAANGEFDNLNKIISGYEGSLDAFSQLEPPALAIPVHEQTIALVERHIVFLKKVRSSASGKTADIWNSSERDSIMTESRRIIAEIRSLEEDYGFHLPDDVLPAN